MGIIRLLAGLVAILVTLAIEVAVIYAVAWFVLIAVRHVPIIGKRHRHPRWADMQATGRSSLAKPAKIADLKPSQPNSA